MYAYKRLRNVGSALQAACVTPPREVNLGNLEALAREACWIKSGQQDDDKFSDVCHATSSRQHILPYPVKKNYVAIGIVEEATS